MRKNKNAPRRVREAIYLLMNAIHQNILPAQADATASAFFRRVPQHAGLDHIVMGIAARVDIESALAVRHFAGYHNLSFGPGQR